MNLWLQFGLMMLFPLGALILILVLLRRHVGQRYASLIMAFILNGFWASGLAADFVGQGVSQTLVFWWHKAAVYALPVAAAAVLFATLTYLRVQLPQQRRWLYLLAGGLVAAAILDPEVIPLGLADLHIAGRIVSHRGWWRIAWTILWAIPSAAALWSIVIHYPREAGPLHRNRVRYWTVTTGVNLLGDLLIMTWRPINMQAGAVVKLLAAVIATVSVLMYRLPDMRDVLRRAIVVLAGGAVSLIVFAAAMVGGGAIQREVQEPRTALWAMVGVALLMVLVYYPIRYLVQKGVERILFRDVFDLDAVLRGYSERISHVLDLEQLAATMIETVDKTLRIDHGALVMVKSEVDGRWTFSPVTAGKNSPLPGLTCAPQSPLVQRLVESCEPLTHYDVDMLPDFAGVSESEREVIKQWGGEFYLPIRARGEVVAVLALSAKRSGDPYLDHDILLLQTLADQTAVALENARLFADLKALNQEITELNQSLGRANLELSELDRLKSSFIGMITHELRSPFVPVDLALQLIERHGLEHMLPEQRDQIQQLSESLAGLRHMIDNLISFASLVSKQRPLQLEKISLGEIVHDAVKTLEVMATARRVSIAVVQVEGLPAIQADRERISDAVYHLVHNGIKFNRSGGTVGVRCDHRDGRVMIEVTDTGRGIPAEKLDSLGDAFTQLADPMKRGIEGIGLGLALVKYIVQAHGGELVIKSQLGVGSTFTMILPVGGPAGTRRGRQGR
jgi:signal transduction histidine kinase